MHQCCHASFTPLSSQMHANSFSRCVLYSLQIICSLTGLPLPLTVSLYRQELIISIIKTYCVDHAQGKIRPIPNQEARYSIHPIHQGCLSTIPQRRIGYRLSSFTRHPHSCRRSQLRCMWIPRMPTQVQGHTQITQMQQEGLRQISITSGQDRLCKFENAIASNTLHCRVLLVSISGGDCGVSTSLLIEDCE